MPELPHGESFGLKELEKYGWSKGMSRSKKYGIRGEAGCCKLTLTSDSVTNDISDHLYHYVSLVSDSD